MKRSGFTMIELVFVIVLMGILSSIAMSQMAVSRDDALIAKARSNVSAIQSAITLVRSKNMMRGVTSGGNPEKLDTFSGVSNAGNMLFDYDSDSTDEAKKLLDYPIKAVDSGENGWSKTAYNEYTLHVNGTDIVFTYDDDAGTFNCTAGTASTAQKTCAMLMN